MNIFDAISISEGNTNPNTLLGYQEQPGGRFAGTQISGMTLDELYNFTSGSSPYADYSRGAVGRMATPLGQFQIVGTTLRNTAKELGLPGDTVFTPEVQKQMGEHLLNNRLARAGNDPQAIVSNLRAEWEGLKKLPGKDILHLVGKHVGGEEGMRLKALADDFTEKSNNSSKLALDYTAAARDDYKVGEEVKAPRQGPDPLGRMQMVLGQTGTATDYGFGMEKSMQPYTLNGVQGAMPAPPLASLASPEILSAMDASTQKPVATSTQDSSTEEADEAAGTGFSSRLAETLFPNREDPNASLRNTLMALSQGLGQMGGGQPVDLTRTMNTIIAERQNAAKQAQDAYQSSIDNQIRMGNLAVAEQNARTTAARLAFDMQGTAGDPMPFNEQQLMEFTNDPDLAPFVDMLGSPNEGTRDEGVKGVRQVLQDRVTKAEADNPAIGELYRELSLDDPDPNRVADIIDRGQLSSDDVSKITSAIDKPNTNMMKTADMLADPTVSQEKKDALLMLQRSINGNGESPIQQEAREAHSRFKEQAIDKVTTNAPINAHLDSMERTTRRMMDEGKESSAFNGVWNRVAGALRLASPESLAWLEQNTGLDADAYAALDRDQAALALLIAQPLMKGTGTVTDAERRSLLQMVASGETSNEMRLEIIAQLKALNKLDEYAANTYLTEAEASVNQLNDFTGTGAVRDQLQLETAKMAPLIGLQARSSVQLEEIQSNEDLAALGEENPLALHDAIAPYMTDEQFQKYKHMMRPSEREGRDPVIFWTKIMPSGERRRMATTIDGRGNYSDAWFKMGDK